MRRSITIALLASVSMLGTGLAVADVYIRSPGTVFATPGGPNGSTGGGAATTPTGTGTYSHGAISLAFPTKFGLTKGVAVDLALTGGAQSGSVYALKNAIAGLAADPTTGRVTGTPTGSVGTSYDIVVEAKSASGQLGATSPSATRILRDPLTVDVVPADQTLTAGQTLPANLVTGAVGGDGTAPVWSLENAPAWLEIASNANGTGLVRTKSGSSVASTPQVAVGVKATDAEGRVSPAKTFKLTVSSPPVVVGPPSAADAMRFGTSVAVSADGSTLVVGATSASSSGRVYVYGWNGTVWTHSATLSGTSEAGSFYGGTVDVSSDGTVIAVGAMYVDTGPVNSGSAYVYRKSGGNWNQTNLQSEAATGGGWFGMSVALSDDGNTLVVGEPSVSFGGKSGAGKVYVYKYQTTSWNKRAVLSGNVTSDYLGLAVDVSGDGTTIAAGGYAFGRTVNGGTGAGVTIVFGGSDATWTQNATLFAAEAGGSQYAGEHLAISRDGGTIVATTNVSTVGGFSGAGSAYVYKGSGTSWTQTGTLSAPSPATNDKLGTSVAVSSDGTKIVLGAPERDPSGVSGAGAAYFFSKSGSAWAAGKEMLAPDPLTDAKFGWGLAMTPGGGTIYSGANRGSFTGVASGSVYVMSAP